MMWTSLSKLLPLPRDTLVYCAHEYTQSNARFAVTVDPNNAALQQRKQAIDEARKKVGRFGAVQSTLCLSFGAVQSSDVFELQVGVLEAG